ncbi:hypothetical protein EJ08DRAFT_699152 [Tothia fuscella]|uniref:F-box domain-containing protein n=1 Tax=Tothia fuscella TaxID=1048955 RepID=A0A9P4NN27_9PEZI|nr:hypothetical protein EJ08DRAFT_699152 [Tothia fuscella]
MGSFQLRKLIEFAKKKRTTSTTRRDIQKSINERLKKRASAQNEKNLLRDAAFKQKASKAPFAFLQLPAEIRIMVYKLVLLPNSRALFLQCEHVENFNILLVNRQIYHEARKCLYENTTFIFQICICCWFINHDLESVLYQSRFVHIEKCEMVVCPGAHTTQDLVLEHSYMFPKLARRDVHDFSMAIKRMPSLKCLKIAFSQIHVTQSPSLMFSLEPLEQLRNLRSVEISGAEADWEVNDVGHNFATKLKAIMLGSEDFVLPKRAFPAIPEGEIAYHLPHTYAEQTWKMHHEPEYDWDAVQVGETGVTIKP